MNASYCAQIQSSLESIHHQGTLRALTALENSFATKNVGLPLTPAKELRPLDLIFASHLFLHLSIEEQYVAD